MRPILFTLLCCAMLPACTPGPGGYYGDGAGYAAPGYSGGYGGGYLDRRPPPRDYEYRGREERAERDRRDERRQRERDARNQDRENRERERARAERDRQPDRRPQADPNRTCPGDLVMTSPGTCEPRRRRG